MTRPDLETQMALLDRVEPALADPHVAFIQEHYQAQMDRPLAPGQIVQALQASAPASPPPPNRPRNDRRRTVMAFLTFCVIWGGVGGSLLINAVKPSPPVASAPPVPPTPGPVYQAYGPVVGAHQVAEAVCPTHTVVTGGGYVLSGYKGGANAPMGSYPKGNSWAVAPGEVAAQTQFQPYALCAPAG